jgi:hypothetical protein
MKLIATLPFLLFSLPLFAAPPAETPLLLHAYDEGLVPPYLYHRASCAIFADKIVIQRNYAGVKTEEIRPLTFPEGALEKLQALIVKASTGTIQGKDAPTDLPYDGYTATVRTEAPSIILKQSQSSSVKENQALEAKSLILFIDAHCPNITR